MWRWGKMVRICRLFSREFCVLCIIINRLWSRFVLGRSPTFIK